VFRTNALEKVLVFPAVKAAQRVPAQDINLVGCGYLVQELFKPNRSGSVTFRPQESCTFSANHNPGVLSFPCFGSCGDEISGNFEESN